MQPIRVKTVQESDLRMLGNLARNIQRVLPVTQADIDAAAALGKGWVVWKVFEVSDPLDNLRGGTQLIIRQNSIQPGQNVRRVIFVSGPGGQTVVIRGTDYIALPDAIANSLQYVKAFGGTEQNGIPTPDAPMDIVSNNGVLKYGQYGKNLYDKSDDIIGKILNDTGSIINESNGFYSANIPVSPNTTYTVSQNSTVSGIYLRVLEYNNADTVVKLNKGTTAGVQNQTFTTSATTKYVIISGLNAGRDTLQLELGNQATEYEPYHYGLHTDGTVETIGIKDSNNLLPVDAQPDVLYPVTVTSAGGWTASANVANGQNLAACEIRYYNANKQQINYYTLNEYSDGRMYKTFSVTTSVKYVSISRKQAYATTPVTELKVEIGGTMTPYYNGGTATTEMLLKVGDYQDVQSILDGVVTRNIGVKVLDGTEDWSRTDVRTKLVLDDSAIGSANWESYCTHYQGFPGSASIGNMPDNSCKINVNTNELLIKDATHNTDITTWKQWLADQYAAGTPVIIVYPLATPTTESVTGQTLQVTDGDNVLEITQASLAGLELEAEYQAAVSLTIQEVQDANLDNNVEVTIS